MSVRVINAILDGLAACARTMFQVGLGLVQWNLDAAKGRRRERERQHQEVRGSSATAAALVGGSAWEPTPWRAVQRAAWEVFDKG